MSTHRCLVLPFGVGKGQDAVRTLMRSILDVPATADNATRFRVIEGLLGDDLIASDQVIFLNELLDLPQPAEQRTLYDAMDNTARNEGKQRVASAVVEIASRKCPLLVMIEDVHWADGVILGHLSSLTNTIADCRALLVMSSRIEGDQLDQTWRTTVHGVVA